MLGDAIAESGGAELLEQVESLRKVAIAFRGRPSDTRRRRVTDLVGSARPRASRGRDPRVHLLLPVGQPGRGTSARAHAAHPEQVGPAGRGLDRCPRGGSGLHRRSPDHACADGAPHRGEASCGGRAPVADRRVARAAGGSVARRVGRAGDPAQDARGDRRSVAHRPHPAPPARAARRGTSRPGAVRSDDLHDAPGGLSRDGSTDRRRRLWCATTCRSRRSSVGAPGWEATGTGTRG